MNDDVCPSREDGWRWWEAHETDWRAAQEALRRERPIRAERVSASDLAALLLDAAHRS